MADTAKTLTAQAGLIVWARLKSMKVPVVAERIVGAWAVMREVKGFDALEGSACRGEHYTITHVRSGLVLSAGTHMLNSREAGRVAERMATAAGANWDFDEPEQMDEATRVIGRTVMAEATREVVLARGK